MNTTKEVERSDSELIHPSERDYSSITSYDQKYCASIFYRGWKLKSQTLYSQYLWFEQFEERIIEKINSRHKIKTSQIKNGSYGSVPVDNDKISIKYEVIDNKLYLTVTGMIAEEFYKRGTKHGFEYGTINQAGVTIRSRKLQTWGFLDFIRIYKQSPHSHRIFEIDLDLYEDYKNQVNYIVNEKKAWIRHVLNRKKSKRPLSWTLEKKPIDWVRQTINMKNQIVKEFFLRDIKHLQGTTDTIKEFKKMSNYNFDDNELSADLCLDLAIKKGFRGVKNNTFMKIINSIEKKSSSINNKTRVKEYITQTDTYLALNGVKRIEIDNENRGATKIFRHRMKKVLRKNISSSPLVRFNILTDYQADNCKFELGWGIGEWNGFFRSDIFAPDIVITNGKKGIEKEIYAVIQIKGQSRTSKKHHPTSIFYQLLELKRYELNAGIKTAMVVIETNHNKESINYNWLVFDVNTHYRPKFFGTQQTMDKWVHAINNYLVDPIFPRNARARELGKEIHKHILQQKWLDEEITNKALKMIKKRIIKADKRFAQFTKSSSLQSRVGRQRFIEILDRYLNSIESLISHIITETQKKNIDHYPTFQFLWTDRIYKHYFKALNQYFGLKK
jgi:hypothetical protein